MKCSTSHFKTCSDFLLKEGARLKRMDRTRAMKKVGRMGTKVFMTKLENKEKLIYLNKSRKNTCIKENGNAEENKIQYRHCSIQVK